MLVDEHRLATLHVSDVLGADEVERAGFGRDDPVVVDPPQHEWAKAVRVAERDQCSLRERDDRVRTFEASHRVRDGVVERRLVVGDQRRDHLAVGRGAQRYPLGAELLAERALVDEVAVVAERDRTCAAVLHERLRVRPL